MKINRNQLNRLDRLKAGILSYVYHYNQTRKLTPEKKDEIKSIINKRVEQYQTVFANVYDHTDSTIEDIIIYN